MAYEKRHEKRVVIVTGGTGSIGEAIARRYLHEGARVGIVDLNVECGNVLAVARASQGYQVVFAAAADVGVLAFPASS